MNPLRIGFDIDGVLADFVPAYQRLHIVTTGRDTFLPGDNVDPPSWNWPALRGYSGAETSLVEEHIKEAKDFWRWLQPMRESCYMLRNNYARLSREHDLYFITTRLGTGAKKQTEQWLVNWVIGRDYDPPTVLLAQYRKKGQLALGLGLDCYIDDNYENCTDIVRDSPRTRTYLLHRRYNEKGTQAKDLDNVWYSNAIVEERRVPSVEQFLKTEGLLS